MRLHVFEARLEAQSFTIFERVLMSQLTFDVSAQPPKLSLLIDDTQTAHSRLLKARPSRRKPSNWTTATINAEGFRSRPCLLEVEVQVPVGNLPPVQETSSKKSLLHAPNQRTLRNHQEQRCHHQEDSHRLKIWTWPEWFPVWTRWQRKRGV